MSLIFHPFPHIFIFVWVSYSATPFFCEPKKLSFLNLLSSCVPHHASTSLSHIMIPFSFVLVALSTDFPAHSFPLIPEPPSFIHCVIPNAFALAMPQCRALNPLTHVFINIAPFILTIIIAFLGLFAFEINPIFVIKRFFTFPRIKYGIFPWLSFNIRIVRIDLFHYFYVDKFLWDILFLSYFLVVRIKHIYAL